MRERVLALKLNINHLILLLEEIKSSGINSVTVHISEDDDRVYDVSGIRDALETLNEEVVSATANALPSLEEKFEHDRLDVYRIVVRLAEIAAAWQNSGHV